MTFSLASFLGACPGAIAQGVIWGLLALGVYLTFRLLDFADLTVDNCLCTGGAVSAVLILRGMNPLLSLVFSVLAGMAAGAITGLLHTKLKIPAILSGILTQLALYSINMRIMGRANLPLLKVDTVLSLQNIPRAIGIGMIFIVVAIAALYWFFGTELGCSIRATGNNGHMARALGTNTDMTKILCLVISNGLVGLAGGLLAQYQGFADVKMGLGAIIYGLASVIIGEVIFSALGGNFAVRLAASVGGAIVYFVIIALVLQAGLEPTDLKLLSAVVVACALALPNFKKSKPPKPAAVVAAGRGTAIEKEA